MRKLLICSVGLIAFGSLIGAARAADPFYAGKTIHLHRRLCPRWRIRRHVPSDGQSYVQTYRRSPTIVVQNMAGAGGANAINYVSEVARPDGLTALCGTVNTLLQLLKDPALRVDINKFQWIFGVPDAAGHLCSHRCQPGLKQPTDFFKATDLIAGWVRVNNSKDIQERLALDLLGVKYKYVTGFNGEGAARAALQQNFINTFTDAVSSYVAVDVPTLVKPGIVVPIFQSGMPDENGELTKPSAAVPTSRAFTTSIASNSASRHPASNGTRSKRFKASLRLPNAVLHLLQMRRRRPSRRCVRRPARCSKTSSS